MNNQQGRTSWQPGTTIVLREVVDGRIRSARPLLVLADEPAGLVGYLAPRSQVAWPRLLDGAQSRTPDQGWALRLEQWQGPGCLFQLPAGEAFAAVLFIDPKSCIPLGWKVDFLAPPTRTAIGLDTLDWALDLLAPPDLSGWTVKDEDDLAQLTLLGVLTGEAQVRLRRARKRAEAALTARNYPFTGRWAGWRPSAEGIDPLTLPPGWDVPNGSEPAPTGRPPAVPPEASESVFPSVEPVSPSVEPVSPSVDVALMPRSGLPRSGRGCRLLDAAGNSWLDLDLCSGSLLHGHAHPAVVGAITRQSGLGLGRMASSGPGAVLADELARRHRGLGAVAWADSGRHALQLAIGLARRATGRRLVATWSPASDDAELLVLPPDPALARNALAAEDNPLAAVVVEGLSLLDALETWQWPGLRDDLLHLRSRGTVLVADERRTLGAGPEGGRGRLGLGDQCDLVVHGAVLFGGLTGGALCGRAELIGQLSRTLIEPFGRSDPGQEGTGALHPVLAAAALATLHEATPAALDTLEQSAAELRSMLGTTGLGPAVRLPAGSDPDRLTIHRVLVDREWAWLSTATDDDDVAEAIEKLRR